MPARRAAAFLLLAGCALPPGVANEQAFARTSDRAGQSILERPFARGSLAVVAPELGEAETMRLVPCQGGRAVCGGDGRVGTLRVTRDWTLVSGPYGRTFWLSPGGDGYVQEGGALLPLAWDAEGNGTGPGIFSSLEQPVPHGGLDRVRVR